MRARLIAGVLLLPLMLAGCSDIYTPEKRWSQGYELTQPSDQAKVATASRIDTGPALRSDLHACVAAFDPQHVSDLDNGGDYKMSGWFVLPSRTAPVKDCMAKKGWLLTADYTPDDRNAR